MVRINDNVFHFDSIFDLDTYAAKKYKDNAMYFFEGDNCSDFSTGIRVFAITFNKLQEITNFTDEGKMYISIADIKQKPSEMCAILGALNVKKSDLTNIHCYNDGRHVYIVSSKPMSTIELGVLFIDKEVRPDWINVLYALTYDTSVKRRLLDMESTTT